MLAIYSKQLQQQLKVAGSICLRSSSRPVYVAQKPFMMSSTTSESVSSTSSSNLGSNHIYSTSLSATSSKSTSGTIPRLPDPQTTGNEQFRLVDTDIQRVTQTIAHVISHFPTAQSQPNPITVGSSPVRTPHSSKG